MSVYDKFKRKAAESLFAGAPALKSTDLRVVQVRLTPEYCGVLDELCDRLDESRQTLLAPLLYDLIDQALDGFASAHPDPEKVIFNIRKAAGFVYGKHTKTEFFSFCSSNNLDPDDESSMEPFMLCCEQDDERERFEAEQQAWLEHKEGNK